MKAFASLPYVENEKVLNDILSEGIGYVQQRLPCKTIPPKSSAEGNGIINAIVGPRVQFVLTTRNTDGRWCYSERDKVTLEINNQQRHDCMAEVQIEDREDGTYSISYFVTEAGKLDVSVKVNDNHVRGSPFGIQVKDREYNTCVIIWTTRFICRNTRQALGELQSIIVMKLQ